MYLLEIHLLGAPTLLWNGSLISITRRQVRALLYRLAADMEPVSRDHLCWLFWPDTEQAEAHRNLSHLLTHLRCALPGDEMLIFGDDTVLLDTEHVWSDSATFQKVLHYGQKTNPIKAAEQAVALYHGPFVDSFALDGSNEYESWVTIQRAALEKCYLAALSLLADSAIHNQNYQTAIQHIQRAIAVDPFDESLHQRLMKSYVAAGNRVAAIREFDEYSDYLRKEMAMEPLPETEAVIRNLCHGNSWNPFMAIEAKERVPTYK